MSARGRSDSASHASAARYTPLPARQNPARTARPGTSRRHSDPARSDEKGFIDLLDVSRWQRHTWPVRIATLLGLATALLVVCMCFVPLIDTRRLAFWRNGSSVRTYDWEEAYRWQGDARSALKPVPFMLNRFGDYSRDTKLLRPTSVESADALATSSGKDRAALIVQSFKSTQVDSIPKIVHFVPPGGDKFTFVHYLAIRSAVHHIEPTRILAHMMHSLAQPGVNFWWDEARQYVEVVQTTRPTQIMGQPIEKPSHMADVIRMEALLKYGGIYLDSDVIVTRSFDELLDEDVVLGIEAAHGSMQPHFEVEGLCNAVMMAKPEAPFMRNWYEEYRTFDKDQWNYHSVQLPWKLAKNATTRHTRVTVLDHRALFFPLWDDHGLRWVHGTLHPPANATLNATNDPEELQHGMRAPESPGWSFKHTEQFAYHMWHHILRARIGWATGGDLPQEHMLDPDDIIHRDSSYNRIVRDYLDDDIMQRWHAFVAMRERQRRDLAAQENATASDP
ncbi:glycosyltransferase family 32 protein [Mixia osmundae IAM 14324]|uniref:Alpha 1,4-glycosyltransferase domain-containing protein n=1 Tax=Mixia osmundae (strain CBS 9802 / IAM 14324 / JCM 22182 / KY 12970) TaxID=764103 RepID=G7DZP1_MIXOS|nr:glycosyltransferase family 32 protein [Mixia osmundae IAM 14324]KEI39289.1 glycosyltransferase family 32 protein [Mixia osmundae IAM 14324]GAA96051.1 hypothetical protein E5Q_02712 [Mixia osmundae IAM 14324]